MSNKPVRITAKILKFFMLTSVSFFVLMVLIATAVIVYYSRDLPDPRLLTTYMPSLKTTVYSADGQLLRKYAREKRIFTPVDQVPALVKQAFLAAEDRNFYYHHGIDVSGIMRAMWNNITKENSLQGASTITQQVAKNIVLSDERTISRKIKEAIIAVRMSYMLSKDRVLEIYLNEIYLGAGSYGVTQAALTYFNKPLKDLNIEEAALLAAMPKAPSVYNPWKNYDAALNRRNWVISAMADTKFITFEQAQTAFQAPIKLQRHAEDIANEGSFFVEEVRKELVKKLGESKVYEAGLNVYTTLDMKLQKMVEKSFRNGLMDYDMRHGYSGPMSHTDSTKKWQEFMSTLSSPPGYEDWEIAIILKLHNDDRIIEVGFTGGDTGFITYDSLKWAVASDKSVADVFKVGDVIFTERNKQFGGQYELRQIPEVNGAMVVMEPRTGKVLAMVGGFNYADSKFNRATQAKRQPGSAFKPFVYLTAFQNGFKPSDLIDDEPIEFRNKISEPAEGVYEANLGSEEDVWSPKNYTGFYYGPTTLRTGVEKSINVMTVRLAMLLGLDKIVKTAKDFGIYKTTPQRNLSTALGAAETDLLSLTNAYSILANGGNKVSPVYIERVEDSKGNIIYKNPEISVRLISEEDDYQIVSVMEGVVQRGTAIKAKELNIPLAGKTGTTDDNRDAWFIGFTPELAAGVFVGFDTPKSLGKKELGSTVAVPIFVDFMRKAMEGRILTKLPVPPTIRMVSIDNKTGALVSDDTPDSDIVLEAFKVGTEPMNTIRRDEPIQVIGVDGQKEDFFYQPSNQETIYGTGGIY